MTDAQVQRIIHAIERKSSHLYLITEKNGDERHVHFGALWTRPTTVSRVNEYLRRFLSDDIGSTGSLPTISVKCKCWFEGAGWQEYLEKEDDTIVWVNTMD